MYRCGSSDGCKWFEGSCELACLTCGVFSFLVLLVHGNFGCASRVRARQLVIGVKLCNSSMQQKFHVRVNHRL